MNSDRYIPDAPPSRSLVAAGRLRAIVAVVVLVLLLGGGAYSVYWFSEKKKARDAQFAVDAAKEQLRKSASALFKDANTLKDDASVAELKDFQKDLKAVGDSQTGEKAKSTRAAAQILKQMNERMEALQNAQLRALELGLFDFTDKAGKNALTERHEAARDHLQQSERFLDFLENSEARVRAAYLAEGANEKAIAEFMEGFRGTTGRLESMLRTKRMERAYLKSVVELLHHLESEWEHWEGEPLVEISSDSEAFAKKYDELTAELKTTFKAHTQAEEAWVEAVKKGNKLRK